MPEAIVDVTQLMHNVIKSLEELIADQSDDEELVKAAETSLKAFKEAMESTP